MGRIVLVMVVVGAILGLEGIRELTLSGATSAEPIDVKLSELEAGNVPFNNHFRVGEHVAVYPAAVYEYDDTSFLGSDPTPSSKVNVRYYPIVSKSNPALARLRGLARRHRGFTNLPDNTPLADAKYIAVLVRSRRFKTVGSIPFKLATKSSVQGLVINQISSLGSEPAKLLRESFPNLDTEKVLILDEGRKPASLAQSLGMIFGGGAVILLAVLILVWKMGHSGRGGVGQAQSHEYETAYSR